MNKAGEGDAPGAPKKDLPVPPKPQEPAPKAQDNPPPEEGGDSEYDELGYKKVPKEKPVEGDPQKKADPPKKGAPKEPEKVENPATGYGDKEPEIEEPKEEEPPKDPPPPPTDLEKKLEGLAPGFADHVKAQITELGLEGEKLDKFIALKRQEQKNGEEWNKKQQREAVRQEQLRRQQWHKELKEDPVFGGEQFMVNVSRSEKVLDEYLPELKKELTEAKQVLRPSVMRGLARLADLLYPDDKMIQGDPPAPVENDKPDNGKNDPLAFYT